MGSIAVGLFLFFLYVASVCILWLSLGSLLTLWLYSNVLVFKYSLLVFCLDITILVLSLLFSDSETVNQQYALSRVGTLIYIDVEIVLKYSYSNSFPQTGPQISIILACYKEEGKKNLQNLSWKTATVLDF